MMDATSDGSSVVCVLAERSYFHGVAALTNSLISKGFSGQVLVGYRGQLPNWAAAMQEKAACAQITNDVTMRFVPVGPAPDGSEWNLSNMKPHFLRQAATIYCPNADAIFYFDVDIVIECAWSHYRRWVKHGVVVVQDMAETAMPANHAYRGEWRALAERAGHSCRELTGYYNGGFLGISRENLALLDIWAELITLFATEVGINMARMLASEGKPEFVRMDQDLLNVALMASRVPLSVLGREAMGCFPKQDIMYHAMIFAKPWQRNYILDALKGLPPDIAHKGFWRHTYGPVQSFPASTLRRKRLEVRIARWIGLFRRRAVADW
jgi:hypothetical protein